MAVTKLEMPPGAVQTLDDEVGFVALVDRAHGGFGVGPFGADPRNGQRLLEFVRSEYEDVRQIGAVPFRERGFGVTILRRRAPGSAASPAQIPPPAQINR